MATNDTPPPDQSPGTPETTGVDQERPVHLRPWWVPWVAAALVAGAVVGVGSYFVYGRDDTIASMDMDRDDHVVPPVLGLYQGEEIQFLHTEASDPDVADMLTDMMGSPVIVVDTLADIPDNALADVYVFTNGIQPDNMNERGPFGFQPDVFDSVPDDSGYSPLRTVNLVTWADESSARELGSTEDIDQAEAAGEITIEQPGIVVNMPIIDWPDGSR